MGQSTTAAKRPELPNGADPAPDRKQADLLGKPPPKPKCAPKPGPTDRPPLDLVAVQEDMDKHPKVFGHDPDEARDFAWGDDPEDIAINEQRAIAVYENRQGEIVVRQQGGVCDDGDDVVIVRASDVERLTNAMLYAAGIVADREPPKG